MIFQPVKLKTMRSNKYILLLILLSGIFSGSMISCKKSSSAPDYHSDKTRLKSVIDSLTAVSAASVEGNKPGQYIPGAKEALDSVIGLGQSVYSANNYTQEQVNNALNNLLRAGNTFSTQLLQRLDQNGRLDRHVKRTGDPRTLQRLRCSEFLAARHEAGHFGFGDGDFLPAPIGQTKILDNKILLRAHMRHSSFRSITVRAASLFAGRS